MKEDQRFLLDVLWVYLLEGRDLESIQVPAGARVEAHKLFKSYTHVPHTLLVVDADQSSVRGFGEEDLVGGLPLERATRREGSQAHLVNLDLSLRKRGRFHVFNRLRTVAGAVDNKGEQLLAQTCLAQELQILMMQDRDAAVEASEQVVAKQGLRERGLTRHGALEDPQEVLDDV